MMLARIGPLPLVCRRSGGILWHRGITPAPYVRELSLSACSFGEKVKKPPPPPMMSHHQAAKIQFGPLLLSKSLEKRSKKNSEAIKNMMITSEDSSHHWLCRVKQKPADRVVAAGPEPCESRVPPPQMGPTPRPAQQEKQEAPVLRSSDPKPAGVNAAPQYPPIFCSGVGQQLEPAATGEKSGILRLPHYRQQTRGLPSVTTILKETMSEESRRVLAAWEERMIKQLGEKGFQELKEATFRRGKELHSWVESLLAGGLEPRLEEIQDPVSKRLFTSLRPLLRDQITGVLALESSTIHPQLNYCGIVDCVAVVGELVCLIDWKTSEKAKLTVESLYDAPLQLAAYIGAVNADPAYSSAVGQIRAGAVVVAYNSGYPAAIHRLGERELRSNWELWLQRLELFNNQRKRGA